MLLSFNDCINCLQPIKQFHKIPNLLQPKIVLKKSSQRIADDFFAERLGIPLPKENVIYSDSLFDALHKGFSASESFVHITWKNEVIRSIRLNVFQQADLEPFLAVNVRFSPLLPNSRPIGAVASISFQKNHFSFYDYQLGKYYVFSRKDKKLLNVFQGKSFNRLKIYEKIFGDTVGYYNKIVSQEKILRQVNKADVSLEFHQHAHNNTDFLELSLSYSIVKDEDHYIYKEPLFAEWKENTDFTFYKFVPDKKFLEKNSSSLYSYFSVGKNEAYALIDSGKPDSTTSLVAKLRVDNIKKEIFFQEYKYPKFPKFVPKDPMSYSRAFGYIRYPYYFYIYENLIVDINTGKEYQWIKGNSGNTDFFLDKSQTIKPNFYIYNVIEYEKGKYRALLLHQKRAFIIDFDDETKIASKPKEIALPINEDFSLTIGGFTFADKNTIWSISPETELIEITF
jgi:hypothetical protein